MRFEIKNEWGRRGEDIAAEFLMKRQYQILKRNFRTSGSEVDIIAELYGTLCFIEVKTRKSGDHGFPEEFVNIKKMKKIIRAARIFTANKKFEKKKIRFDIISIVYSDQGIKIDHMENAFENDFD
jgi:putative endonuclease